MVGSRTATALVGLAASLAVSVAAWYHFDTLVAFLLLPFVPVLFRRGDDARPSRTCPACGFTSDDPAVAYCPRDGTPLDSTDGGGEH